MTPRRDPALRLAAALLAAATTSLLAGCGGEEPEVTTTPTWTVTVVGEEWNGWAEDDDPTRRTYELPATPGAEVEVEALGEPVVLEVTEVSADGVVLGTSSPMAPEGETGGANLNDLTSELAVHPGSETSFSTPTLDAGVTYTATLVEDR